MTNICHFTQIVSCIVFVVSMSPFTCIIYVVYYKEYVRIITYSKFEHTCVLT